MNSCFDEELARKSIDRRSASQPTDLTTSSSLSADYNSNTTEPSSSSTTSLSQSALSSPKAATSPSYNSHQLNAHNSFMSTFAPIDLLDGFSGNHSSQHHQNHSANPNFPLGSFSALSFSTSPYLSSFSPASSKCKFCLFRFFIQSLKDLAYH